MHFIPASKLEDDGENSVDFRASLLLINLKITNKIFLNLARPFPNLRTM